MNTVQIIGRLTKDPVVRYADELAIAQFSVAVDRHTKEKKTDFINCKAFGKTAELIEKYVTKGSQIGIEGSIQTGSYENKDGQKVYATDVAVSKIEFLGKSEKTETTEKPSIPSGFAELTEDESDIPF